MSEDVIIYMRDIKLDVVIPEPHAWEFMEEFGVVFAIASAEGPKILKAVDGYYAHGGGWHIHVSVWENKEEAFYQFLEKFCKKRKLSFRDPRHSE